MPLLITNVEWNQNQSDITLKIPLKGHSKSADNVVIWRKFLKINVPPYFFDVFFEHPVDDENSTCKILDSGIVCTLKKTSNEWWTRLGRYSKADNADDAISSSEKEEILREYEASIAQVYKERNTARDILKRSEIDKEMQRRYEIQRKIDEIQQNLKDQHIHPHKNDDKLVQAIPDKIVAVKEEPKRPKPAPVRAPQVPNNPLKSLPPIRSFNKIEVTFSERRFITPKRESQDYAEQEWCTKQHEYMKKSIGFCDEDLNDDERDPTWLLNKGNEFYEQKNFLAAVSAFTSGLGIASEAPDLYLARANAQFQLANYKRCVEDSTQAYERFKPAVQSNLKDRIKCLELRGKSLIELGYKQQGESELKMATKLA